MAGPESGRSGRGKGREQEMEGHESGRSDMGQLLGWESKMVGPESGRSGRGASIRLKARDGRTRVWQVW